MATPSTSTAILLRQSLSDALGLPADQVPLEANLIEWGLDSVTLIRLAGQWRRQGLAARFADLVADPRLCAWLALLDTAPTATAPISTEKLPAPEPAAASTPSVSTRPKPLPTKGVAAQPMASTRRAASSTGRGP